VHARRHGTQLTGVGTVGALVGLGVGTAVGLCNQSKHSSAHTSIHTCMHTSMGYYSQAINICFTRKRVSNTVQESIIAEVQ
jgi:hypothetical protein